MLYTRAGDDGTTRLFNGKTSDRISKSSPVIEALGSLDELNSFLGLVKVKALSENFRVEDKNLDQIIDWIQECLFTIQAELAGADKKLSLENVKYLEKLTDSAEKTLPPIKTFIISGGTELSALLDIARTKARLSERRLVEVFDHGIVDPSPLTKSFLNRLSSLLYALARMANFMVNMKEGSPHYN